MHIDARELPNNSLIEGDICIIGAGAAGISIAIDWLNTGHKVILLEGGGFEVDETLQDLYRGKTTGQRYYPLKSARLHYFGGTTGHWGGYCATLDDIDFVKRDWVPLSGWPISRKDIDPYYPLAGKMVEIGPGEFEDTYWLEKDKSLLPLVFDTKVVWNKMWQFSPFTRFGDKYRDAIVNAKNVHLYTYANVTDIMANENASSITGVTVKNLQGKTHTVRAKYFVLACCAIQNARLLLASNKQAPNGLGNDHDIVGRHFMDHLEVNSANILLPAPLPLKFYLNDPFVTKARAELAITGEVQRQHGMLNGTVALSPLELVKNDPPMIDFFPDSATKTVQHWPYLEKMFKAGKLPASAGTPFKAYRCFTRMEQSPNPESRVTLDTEKDALGVPRANLHWKLTRLEKTSIRKLHILIGQQAGISGIGRLRMMDWLDDENDNNWPETLGGGWHHMGTTRMHDDPKQGVVDSNCKIHSINNLFAAGSSCFTTSGAANPTLTLIALTLRLSDHLKTLV